MSKELESVDGTLTGESTCPECNGEGCMDDLCSFCDGTGQTDDDDVCDACGGTGRENTTCSRCDGLGLIDTNEILTADEDEPEDGMEII